MIANHWQADILDHAFFAINPFADNNIKDTVADIGPHSYRADISLR